MSTFKERMKKRKEEEELYSSSSNATQGSTFLERQRARRKNDYASQTQTTEYVKPAEYNTKEDYLNEINTRSGRYEELDSALSSTAVNSRMAGNDSNMTRRQVKKTADDWTAKYGADFDAKDLQKHVNQSVAKYTRGDYSVEKRDEDTDRLLEKYRMFNKEHALNKYEDLKNAPDFENKDYTAIEAMAKDASYADTFKRAKKDYDSGRMTGDEYSTFSYIADKEGDQAAAKYMEDMQQEFDKRRTENMEQGVRDFMNEGNTFEKATKDVLMGYGGSHLLKMTGGVMAAADDLYRTATGQETNPYNNAHLLNNYANTIQEEVQSDLNEVDHTPFKVLSRGYNITNSALQSAAGAGMFGRLYTGIMGMGAFADEANKLKEEGASDSQIVTGAMAAGVAEALYEYLPTETLLKGVSAGSVKDVLKNVVKQMGEEGLEEGLTELTNTITDYLNRGGASDYAKSIEQYKESGLSDKKAKYFARFDVMANVANASIEGALSGGLSAGVFSGANYLANKETGAAITQYGKETDLVDFAKETATPGSVTEKKLNEIESAGDKATDAQKGALYQTIAEQIVENAPKNNETIEGRIENAYNFAQLSGIASSDDVEDYSIKNMENTAENREQLANIGGKYTGENLSAYMEDKVSGSKQLSAAVSKMTDANAEIFTVNYNGESADVYAAANEHIIEAVDNGWDLAKVKEFNTGLSESKVETLYNQYKKAADLKDKAFNDATVASIAQARFEAGKEGVIDDSALKGKRLNRQQKNMVSLISGLSRKMGVDLVWTYNAADNGMSKGGKVYVDALADLSNVDNAKNTIATTFTHEITHWMKEKAGDAYTDLEQTTLKALANATSTTGGEKLSIEELIANEMQENGIGEEEARDELVARSLENMFRNSSVIDGLVSQMSTETANTLKGKLTKTFKEVKRVLKSALGAVESNTKEAKAIKSYLEHTEDIEKELQDKFDKALAKAISNKGTDEELIKNDPQAYAEKNVTNYSTRVKSNVSVSETVEETKDLIAIHNLTEDKIRKLAKFSGIPMPSIAVTKASLGHSNFGDISFVFRKATIDPKNKKNAIYAADAWTPTFPAIEYDPNYEKIWSIRDSLNSAFEGLPQQYKSSAQSFVSGLEYNLNTYGGEDGVKEMAKDNVAMKAAYLSENGIEVPESTKEVRESIPEAKLELGNKFLDEIGRDNLITNFPNGTAMLEKYEDTIKEILIARSVERGNSREEAETHVNGNFGRRMVQAVYTTARSIVNGTTETVKTEIDVAAMNDFVNQNIDNAAYEKWIDNTFSDIQKGTGIYNGKDVYKPDGSRKTFKQLHYDVTAENIVKAMIAQADGNVRNVAGFHGAKSIRAVVVDQFKNIHDIKKAADKLVHIDSVEYQERTKELEDRLSSVMTEILESSNRSSGNNAFIDYDTIGENILEAAENPTPENVLKTFENTVWNVTEEQAVEIASICNDIRNMPVEMFESKPMRVVGFDEVAYALLPSNTSQDVKDIISNTMGIDIVEYENTADENEDPRKAIIESQEEKYQVRFSKRHSEGFHYDNNGWVVIDRAIVDSYEKMPKKYSSFKKLIRESLLGISGETVTIKSDGRTIHFNRDSRTEYAGSMKTFDSTDINKRGKLNSTKALEEIVARSVPYEAPKGENKKDKNKPKHVEEGVEKWIYYDTFFGVEYEEGTIYYKGLVNVKKMGQYYEFYDLDIKRDLTDTHLVRKNPEGVSNVDPVSILPPDIQDVNSVNEKYMQMVDTGDMEAVKEYVKEYASKKLHNSKARLKDGTLREFYHGTNADNFNVFRMKYLGTGSGDTGFFGKGFYFAFDIREAEYYGKTIKKAYLDIRNPYYISDLYKYNGENVDSYNDASDALFVMNFAKEFPELTNELNIFVYDDKNDSSKARKVEPKAFYEAFDRLYESLDFEVVQSFDDYSGSTVYIARTGKHTESYETSEGQKEYYDVYDYEKEFADERLAKDKFNNVYYYLKEKVYGDFSLPKSRILMMENEFSVSLKSRGYDGILQSQNGDEAVVFDSSQIKNSDAITYDDNGNVIPLSDRFNATEKDTRYSKRQKIYDIDEILDQKERVEKENRELKRDIERLTTRNRILKEAAKLDKTLTNGKVLKESKIKNAAEIIKKRANSGINLEELTNLLREGYSSIKQAEKPNPDEVYKMVMDIGAKVVAKQKPQVIVDDYAESQLKNLKKTRMSFTEDQIQELKYTFGNNWKRSIGTYVTYDENATPLDNQWQELCDQFPGMLDSDIPAADQIYQLTSLYDTLKEGSRIVQYNKSNEEVKRVAREVYNQYWQVDTIETTADKHAKEIKELNQAHRQMMDQMRKKVSDQKLADSMYYGKILEKLRQKKEEEIQAIKSRTKDRNDAMREARECKKLVEKITKTSTELLSWMNKPTQDKHVPDNMKSIVGDVLKSIDFSSKRLLGMTGDDLSETQSDISFRESFEKMANMFDRLKAARDAETDDLDMYLDLPPQFNEDVRQISTLLNGLMTKVKKDNEYILQQMNSEQLYELDQVLTMLKHSVSTMNDMLASRIARNISGVASKTIHDLKELGSAKERSKAGDLAYNFFNFNNTLPVYFFKRLGEGAQHVFSGMQDGWDKFAFDVKKIIDYAEDAYTRKEALEWQKDVKEFEVLDPEKKIVTLKMTVPQIMSLYCLTKREHAIGHIKGGGIRPANFEYKGKTIRQVNGINLVDSELNRVLDTLTDRQKEVADKLQRFMNTTCSEWGNEITLKRFGVRGFTEQNYFPIKSNDNDINGKEAPDTQGSNIYRLLNMSFTKPLTENANNQIVIDNIFDVFASHCADMAKYHCLALPVLDAIKWYNYKEKTVTGKTKDGSKTFKVDSVKAAMEDSYGAGAKSYFMHLLSDLNEDYTGGRAEGIQKGLISKFKTAAVGGNIRVGLLQFTAFFRASAILDSQYLTAALIGRPAIKTAQENSGIAQWKALGFYDTDVARGIKDQIKHAETRTDRLIDKSLFLAEMGDKITWGYLWKACEAQTAAKTGFKKGTEEFNKAASDLFRDVIYKTQVVDSTLTRSDWMRGKDVGTQMLTAFQSEPTVSYNLVVDEFYSWGDDARRTKNGFDGTKRNHMRPFARKVLAYALSGVAAGLVGTKVSLTRKPEEDEEKEKQAYIDAILQELNPLEKLPIFKDAISFFQGNDPTRMDEEAFVQIAKAWDKSIAFIFDGKGTLYDVTYAILRAFSEFKGIPVSNTMRDVTAMWDSTIGEIYTSKKVNKKKK